MKMTSSCTLSNFQEALTLFNQALVSDEVDIKEIYKSSDKLDESVPPTLIAYNELTYKTSSMNIKIHHRGPIHNQPNHTIIFHFESGTWGDGTVMISLTKEEIYDIFNLSHYQAQTLKLKPKSLPIIYNEEERRLKLL